ncbi:MAG: phosphate acyltransferase PlsX [Ferrimicrobium sp.]
MNPVAVDLMGGDSGPAVIVEGVLEALDSTGGEIVVVGTEEACHPLAGDARVRVVHASEEILMSDDPATAPRRKRDASMVVGATLLKEQQVSALITFGNSGAAMATALVKVGRIRGVARPAITVELPVPGTTSTIMLDAGANTEVTPAWLHQFAVMGSVFCAARLNIDRPRVGLLSIGEEPGKGNALVKETYQLLVDEPSINFLGNVEGRDIMSDRVDVVVTDGFTGNIVLKSLEGAAHLFAQAILAALSLGDDGVLDLALPKLLPLWNQMTPDDTGAAALLGVNGLFLIGHGASNARAVASGIRNARQLAQADVVGTIRRLEGSAGE